MKTLSIYTLGTPRPLCLECNKNLRAFSGLPRADGTKYLIDKCRGCERFKKHGMGYKRHKKDKCEMPECGFVAKHPCQLDVDHIDGNRENNDISNLQTLCSNCHRLKTRLTKQDHSKQWRPK